MGYAPAQSAYNKLKYEPYQNLEKHVLTTIFHNTENLLPYGLYTQQQPLLNVSTSTLLKGLHENKALAF